MGLVMSFAKPHRGKQKVINANGNNKLAGMMICRVIFSDCKFMWIINRSYYYKGVTPFFKMIFPYFDVSPVITTAKANLARS